MSILRGERWESVRKSESEIAVELKVEGARFASLIWYWIAVAVRPVFGKRAASGLHLRRRRTIGVDLTSQRKSGFASRLFDFTSRSRENLKLDWELPLRNCAYNIVGEMLTEVSATTGDSQEGLWHA